MRLEGSSAPAWWAGEGALMAHRGDARAGTLHRKPVGEGKEGKAVTV